MASRIGQFWWNSTRPRAGLTTARSRCAPWLSAPGARRTAMVSKGLHVSPDLTLPLDAITQSVALLAVRRAGKSNGAAVMAEEMYHAGLPWVAVDPKGDWWGLRSSKDGTGPGLPIPIFGGLHGDVPLAPEAGKLIADLIVEANLTCVLDVSEFAY